MINIPEIMKQVDGFMQPKELEWLNQMAKDKVVVEIGSWKGQSTVAMALSAKKVYAVDTFRGSSEHKVNGQDVWVYPEFEKNIKKMGVIDKIKVLMGDSSEMAKSFKEKADFIFIDGAHEYEFVKTDFLSWFPHLRGGGIICFHDSLPLIQPSKKFYLLGRPFFHQADVIRFMRNYIYPSHDLVNIGYINSITYAIKKTNNNLFDRIKNRLIFIRKISSYIKRYPIELIKMRFKS